MTEEDDDLKRPAQDQEEWCMMTIEFHRGLKTSTTTFQAVVRQQATINPINSPVRPPIRTLLMTTRSSGLALGEIQTMKPEESA
jgi:hypothetical protein